jgi:hypothetical protein
VIYVFAITIPANTPESAPVIQTLKLTRGKITQMQVHFPSGHLGLTHIGITRGLYQLYPSNAEARFSSSGETIPWDEDLPLDTPPYQLEAIAWNEDDTYLHTITVRVRLAPLEEQASLLDEIKALLGLGGGS